MNSEDMVSKGIVLLSVEHIHPHPDNPRKDLGDLSELAESIKKKGILQNLTVVPIEGQPGEYMAVIGHRRRAAAELAGIKALPCIIDEIMSHKDQVSTMMEENIQRNDLTIIEEAQGFQLMLDLGDTEESLAEKTGFSRTTIRHRLNIAKLDQKVLKKKEKDDSFQLTFKDLYELEKIEDIKIRNKILKEANSSRDLVWKAQSAVKEAERNKKTKQIVDMLKKLGIGAAPKEAESEQYTGKWQIVKEFDLEKDVPKQIKIKETDEVYYLPYYRSVRVIKKGKKEKLPDTPEEAARKQKDRNKKEIRVKLKELNAERGEFIQNIISGKINALKDEKTIQDKIWRVLVASNAYISSSNMRSFFSKKADYECSSEEKAEAQNMVDGLSLTHSMLVAMHYAINNIGDIYDWQGIYKPGTGSALIQAHELLIPYGWTFADEEIEKILDGSHDLFYRPVTESAPAETEQENDSNSN